MPFIPLIVLGGVAALVLYETLFAHPTAKKKGPKAPQGAPPKNPLPPGVIWKGLIQIPSTLGPPSAATHPGLIAIPINVAPPPPDPTSAIRQVVGNLLASTTAVPGSTGVLAHQMVRVYLQELMDNPTVSNLGATIQKLHVSSLGQEGASAAAALALLQSAFPS